MQLSFRSFDRAGEDIHTVYASNRATAGSRWGPAGVLVFVLVCMVRHAVVLDRGQQRAAFLKQNGIGEVNNLYSTPLLRVEITRCLVSRHLSGIRKRVFFNLASSPTWMRYLRAIRGGSHLLEDVGRTTNLDPVSGDPPYYTASLLRISRLNDPLVTFARSGSASPRPTPWPLPQPSRARTALAASNLRGRIGL